MHNNITAEYMKIFTAILEESTFLWGADTALKALGYLQADSQAENKQHTIKIIEYLNSKNITFAHVLLWYISFLVLKLAEVLALNLIQVIHKYYLLYF